MNGNGVKDAIEPGLAKWTINLFDSNGNLISSVTTDPKGMYSFNNLKPGTYIVKEVQQSGWTQTYPAAHGSYTLTIISGKIYTGQDFGNHKL